MDNQEFQALVCGLRAGDAAAAERLVRMFEPQIKRHLRVMAVDPAIRRLIDASDICQSVLANFFARAALGEFDLTSPESLAALLATMARRRLLDRKRWVTAGVRNTGREVHDDVVLDNVRA